MVGGLNSGGSYISSTEIWSPGDSTWTRVSPLPRTVADAGAASLKNRIYLFGIRKSIIITMNMVLILSFIGNFRYGQQVTSDADKVYEWNGDEEKWSVHGTIRERRSHVGVSLVPVSSGVLDHCITS